MPNESAITRLLYAMLSQKCLKDIDWNKVAQDLSLSEQVLNGHAARMRYSRFKKQMEAAQPSTMATVRKPRNKNKVDKNKSSSSASKKSKQAKLLKHEADQDDDDEEYLGHHDHRIKSEYGYDARHRSPNYSHGHNHHHAGRDERHFPTPELDNASMMLNPTTSGIGATASNHHIKCEPGLSSMSANLPMTPIPSTPHTTASFSTTPNYTRFIHDNSASPSPGTSFGANGGLDVMDEMMSSFGMPGSGAGGGGGGNEAGPEEPLLGAEQGYGMGMGMGMGVGMGGMGMSMGMGLGMGMQMHIGLGDPYEGYWDDERERERDGERQTEKERETQRDSESRNIVKSESRWEESYACS